MAEVAAVVRQEVLTFMQTMMAGQEVIGASGRRSSNGLFQNRASALVRGVCP